MAHLFFTPQTIGVDEILEKSYLWISRIMDTKVKNRRFSTFFAGEKFLRSQIGLDCLEIWHETAQGVGLPRKKYIKYVRAIYQVLVGGAKKFFRFSETLTAHISKTRLRSSKQISRCIFVSSRSIEMIPMTKSKFVLEIGQKSKKHARNGSF